LFFSLGLVLFGWFPLTRFQVLLQQKKEDQSLFFGLLGKHLGHAQSSYQSTEKRLEQFGRRLLAADEDPELVEIRSYERKTG
jgi:hypothetical protein